MLWTSLGSCSGLRGKPSTKPSVVTLSMPKFVVEGSNPPLNRPKGHGTHPTLGFSEHVAAAGAGAGASAGAAGASGARGGEHKEQTVHTTAVKR